MNEAITLSKKIKDTEYDILCAIGEIVQSKLDDLSISTGLKIHGINLDLTTAHSIGTNKVDHILHNVRIDVGLPNYGGRYHE